ncbi:MAG: nuclear transport factor 2 family protein [Pedobacter sp.]|nr:MAG: nuclear transport factor 2 family protein [Pedobacter sp.]
MTTKEVAERLVQLCRANKEIEAVDELYAESVKSTEPKGSDRELTEGKKSVKEKTIKWAESVEELHSSSCSDPIVSKDHFSFVMEYDATYKGFGRMAMSEICVYEVKDGKIIADQFFYNM